MSIYDRLREYVKLDNQIIDKGEESDFVKFCQDHNDDITNTLDCLDEILNYINDLDENDFDDEDVFKEVDWQLHQIKNIIKKIVD